MFKGSWDISVVLGWTLWDWGVTYHAAEAARADARASERNLDWIQDAVRVDINLQSSGYRQALERLTASRQAVQSAQQAFRVTRDLFEAGRRTTLDLLEAETELTRARASLVEARADTRIAWARVGRALGRVSP